MKFTIQRITGLESAMRPNSCEVVVDCHMTERQMHDALLVFLEHVSGETWQKWVDEIKEDAP